jgi:hypothetical protein
VGGKSSFYKLLKINELQDSLNGFIILRGYRELWGIVKQNSNSESHNVSPEYRASHSLGAIAVAHPSPLETLGKPLPGLAFCVTLRLFDMVMNLL